MDADLHLSVALMPGARRSGNPEKLTGGIRLRGQQKVGFVVTPKLLRLTLRDGEGTASLLVTCDLPEGPVAAISAITCAHCEVEWHVTSRFDERRAMIAVTLRSTDSDLQPKAIRIATVHGTKIQIPIQLKTVLNELP